jgi:hypothetical protein
MIRRPKVAELESMLAAARGQVQQLTTELQRLRMERLRGDALAAAVDEADRLETATADRQERLDEEWQERVDVLVLRQMLVDLCESVERSMASVRAQLSSGLRPNELDRRRGERRRSGRTPSGRAGAPGVDATQALAAASGPGRNGKRAGNGNGQPGEGDVAPNVIDTRSPGRRGRAAASPSRSASAKGGSTT